MDASERGALIRKFGELVVRDSEYIAELESYNYGGLLSFMKLNLAQQNKTIGYIASLADKAQGDTIPAGTIKNKQNIGFPRIIIYLLVLVLLVTWYL